MAERNSATVVSSFLYGFKEISNPRGVSRVRNWWVARRRAEPDANSIPTLLLVRWEGWALIVDWASMVLQGTFAIQPICHSLIRAFNLNPWLQFGRIANGVSSKTGTRKELLQLQ